MLIPIILLLQAVYLKGEDDNSSLPPTNVGIVGGHEIEIYEAPFQVSVQINGNHHCGGVLVTRDIVITAAHCIENAPYQVRAGSSFHASGGQVSAVRNILKHPNYVPYHNDIAILWLSQPMTLGHTIATIPMPNQGEEVPDGATVQVTGWGKTNPSFPLGSPKLKRLIMRKTSHTECVQTTGVATNHEITDSMICAGLPQAESSCQGDSGGPLVYNGKVVGLVSFSSGCGMPGIPTVHTKVSAFRSWIDANINRY